MLSRRHSMFLLLGCATGVIGGIGAYELLFDDSCPSEKETPLARHLLSIYGRKYTKFGRRLAKSDLRSLASLSDTLGSKFNGMPSQGDLFDLALEDIAVGRFKHFEGWSFTQTEWDVIVALHRV